MKTKPLRTFAALGAAVLFALTSCYSLEDVIDRSRTRPGFYEDRIYWQGQPAGRKRDFSETGAMGYAALMQGQGLYRPGMQTCTTSRYVYDQVTKQNRLESSSTVNMTKIDGARIFDTGGTHVLTLIRMSVPVNGCSWEYEYFTYDETGKTFARVSPNAGILSLDEAWGEMIRGQINLLDRKDAGGSLGRIPEEDEFQARKARSLKEETADTRRTVIVSAGMEGYFYNTVSRAPRDARSKMDIDVAPIYMGYVRAEAAFTNLFFRFQYKSDFGTGHGSVETGSDAADDLAVSRRASAILDLAAGLFGIELGYSSETYRFGRINYEFYEPPLYTTQKTERRDFVMKNRQVSAIYHFLWKDIDRLGGTSRKTKALDIWTGLRYRNYMAPKIRYTEIDKEGDPAAGTVIGESTPQVISFKSYCAGVGANNFLRSSGAGFNPLIGVELFGGYGYTRMNWYDYYHDTAYIGDDKAAAGNNKYLGMGILSPGGTLGVLYNFTAGAVQSGLRLEYRFSGTLLMTDRSGDYARYFNSHFDYFHSVACSFEVML
ncbi:MAG: hypothetical protein EPN93_17055 [Spirochaetes bacterium]|nr:MAG: hypothetical protein EPN93_17055 [Spirochaetota bacterium]